jgi:hypothetical protein
VASKSVPVNITACDIVPLLSKEGGEMMLKEGQVVAKDSPLPRSDWKMQRRSLSPSQPHLVRVVALQAEHLVMAEQL